MRESPRIRRLRSDYRAMNQLRQESSVIDFTSSGQPPDKYIVTFRGQGVWRQEGSNEILLRQRHEVSISLGASYPRMIPELQWRTPIFHPNISASGVVCLGGYGTYWVPSLSLDELCTMLWDMIRYQNFDVESPYNREAALWTRQQHQFSYPVDHRPIRDRVAAGIVEPQKSDKQSDKRPDGLLEGGKNAAMYVSPLESPPAAGSDTPMPVTPLPAGSDAPDGQEDDGFIFLGDVEEPGSRTPPPAGNSEDDIMFIE